MRSGPPAPSLGLRMHDMLESVIVTFAQKTKFHIVKLSDECVFQAGSQPVKWHVNPGYAQVDQTTQE